MEFAPKYCGPSDFHTCLIFYQFYQISGGRGTQFRTENLSDQIVTKIWEGVVKSTANLKAILRLSNSDGIS